MGLLGLARAELCRAESVDFESKSFYFKAASGDFGLEAGDFETVLCFFSLELFELTEQHGYFLLGAFGVV